MAERERATKVVTGSVDISARKKVKDAFIKNDGRTIRNYAFFDVFIPSVKRTIYDLVTRVFGMALFGEKSGGSTLGSSGYSNQYQQVVYRAGDVNYNRSSFGSSVPSRSQSVTSSTGIFDYENWIFDQRGDIEAVLNQATDIIEEYGFVRISDLYDMVGKTAPYTAENYAWKTMNGCEAKLCSGGWRLSMTRPGPIDMYKK